MTRDNYFARYYQINKEILVRRAADRYTTPEGRARTLYNSAKRRAAKMGLEFNLTYERILSGIIIGKCERSGIDFNLTALDTWRNPFAPSVDRKDNSGGYTNENIQIVSNLYNTGKGQHTDDEFIKFCHMVAERNPL